MKIVKMCENVYINMEQFVGFQSRPSNAVDNSLLIYTTVEGVIVELNGTEKQFINYLCMIENCPFSIVHMTFEEFTKSWELQHGNLNEN